jgi:diguanylate cyclase (GGDEF)-like protein
VTVQDTTAERRATDRVAMATVMVVDDSPTTRLIIRRMLEPSGYRILEACDGREALDGWALDPPDLVLLDVDMPVMDGPQLLAALRERDELAATTVMFLTARSRGADVAAGFGLGAVDYVRKPCSAEELRARTAAALDRESERRGLREAVAQADQLSLVDSLTGLANRRRFERRRGELLATESSDTTVALVLLDVDHFKTVNDAQGHLAGDTVLRILSRRLGTVLGREDLLVRWGGEEFLVLAPRHDERAAASLAARLHETVRAAPFAIARAAPLAITASAGWACGGVRELDRLIAVADERLYEAKRTGRNRVAGGPPADRGGSSPD